MKVAVTGGIGSGKSVFCRLIKEAGYPVIEADHTAKDLLYNDPDVRSKIVKAFGPQAYTETGINTKYLAETVFSKPEQVKRINSIVHPAVIRTINQQMNELLKKHNLVFVEAALIYEADMDEMFDYVVVITADEEIKIKRAMERDKVSREEVLRRMESQIPDSQKKGWSDFCFVNNGPVDDLKGKVSFLLHLLKTISLTKPAGTEKDS